MGIKEHISLYMLPLHVSCSGQCFTGALAMIRLMFNTDTIHETGRWPSWKSLNMVNLNITIQNDLAVLAL